MLAQQSKMANIILATIVLVGLLEAANGANILCLMGMASHSHAIWNGVLINALAAKGHNLTVISPDIDKKAPKGVHYILLEKVYEGFGMDTKSEEISVFFSSFIEKSQFEVMSLVSDYYLATCAGSLKSKGLQYLLSYPDDFKFDLVLYDYTGGPCLMGFVHKFNYPPIVGVSPFLNPPYTLDVVGGHFYPAYIPHYAGTYDIEMDFWERGYNTFIYFYGYWQRQYQMYTSMDKLVRPYFMSDMPDINDIQRRTQLALVNSHPATNYPEPTAPNVIEVGGLQITDPNPLPDDLEDFVGKAKKGAVFISMGSNVKSELLGTRRCQMFFDVVAEFPEYNFMWKIDSEFLNQSIPKNLLTRNWFPQRDILAHPKTKAFITHAGGLSTQEAFWFGVPMVGIPIFVDQHRNLRKSVQLNVAVKVDVISMTKDDLHEAVKKVLEDPTYSENIKRRSGLYKDRPSKPLETAVWWVEYVIRNGNLEHLRSPALDLGVLKSNLFDLVAFLAVAVFVVLSTVLCISFKVCACLPTIKQRSKKEKQS